MLLHVWPAVHVSVFNAHSSISLHVTPSPVYPLLHPHVNDPAVLLQVAFTSQLSVFNPHSSISLQLVAPVLLAYPLAHASQLVAHVNDWYVFAAHNVQLVAPVAL